MKAAAVALPALDSRVSAGLTSAEAARRLAAYGPNRIGGERKPSQLRRLARQAQSPLVWLLIAACAVAAALGEAADAVAILVILLLNASIGFTQERRAEHAIEALRSMTAPRATVRRDGHTLVVPAADVVPGDLLALEAGDLVAADGRLLEAHELTMTEAALTGESAPVVKSTEPVPAGAALPDRTDAVFSGTAVVRGTGLAEVLVTGGATELGRIAHLLATAEDSTTPLQQHLASVGRVLLRACLAIVTIVSLLGIWRGAAALDVLMGGVSLAVAAVPEGLPAIVTIALAIGVRRMARREVLIRRLPAVETLGCATVICADKTGTLTTGVMTVRDVWGASRDRVIFAAAACSDAEVARDGRAATGDPLEVAILNAAAELGIRRDDIEQQYPRRHVEPFDAVRKRMSITRADGSVYVKGAIEAVLPLCDGAPPGALAKNADMASRGLRVLAVATGPAAGGGLQMLGLIGVADPPRREAIAAVAAAHRAGIRVVMITGDHPLTATAVARELGILGTSSTPADIVHARATPEDKLTIVRRWKARGEVVAMTGDGANDAPALREAHIGIAMGRTGTEVTREASDMVLADDNFASIIAAVEEGRGIYDNIRKALVYLLAGNAGELIVMCATAAAGLPVPLLPVHLLWINLVTDGLPAIALVMDPPARDLLTRRPRRPDEPMLGPTQWKYVGLVGLLEASVTFAAFAWTLRGGSLLEARSVAFSTLVLAELLRAFAARSPNWVLWELGALTNLRLLVVIAASVLVQIALHHFAMTRGFFGIASLSAEQWIVAFGLALVPVTLIEIAKLARIPAGTRSEC